MMLDERNKEENIRIIRKIMRSEKKEILRFFLVNRDKNSHILSLKMKLMISNIM